MEHKFFVGLRNGIILAIPLWIAIILFINWLFF